jgi:hypothetical protein
MVRPASAVLGATFITYVAAAVVERGCRVNSINH